MIELIIAVLSALTTVLPIIAHAIEVSAQKKERDQNALDQLGAEGFHAGVTRGVQPSATPPVQPQ